jgi:hypothetical protein
MSRTAYVELQVIDVTDDFILTIGVCSNPKKNYVQEWIVLQNQDDIMLLEVPLVLRPVNDDVDRGFRHSFG